MNWKQILNFDGYYEVSDQGEVRSVDRIVENSLGIKFRLKGRIIKPCRTKGKNGDGYYVVNLRKHGKAHVIPIHVLVATAFIPNPLNLPTVNHKDGNKANNTVQNLEWSSYSENNLHALKMGLRQPRGTAIVQCDKDGEPICTYRSVCEAARKTGIGRSLISHCINGRVNSAGGFIWLKLSEGVTTIS